MYRLDYRPIAESVVLGHAGARATNLLRCMTSVAVAILLLVPIALAISAAVTWTMIRVSPRIGFVDKPGGRKIHDNPKPLGGGVGIFVAFALPLLCVAGLVRSSGDPSYLAIMYGTPHEWTDAQRHEYIASEELKKDLIGGVYRQVPLLLAFVGGAFVLHVMGLMDDRRAMGPYSKLIVQLLVAGVLVIGFNMRALTALDQHVGGPWLSYLVTIFWIVAITNAFNFLDNMDGLSAGTAAVCTVAFLITTITIGQWFVAATLACLLGALLGFLLFNFPPAKIFMGDAGSLVVGFVLGVLTVRTTFLAPGESFGAGWYAVFAPLIVLAVPLYDLIVVSIIRMSRGKSPFVGDRNHFSHRLVARGMTKRTAVLCIYLVSAATAIAAIILPQVKTTLGAVLVLLQTLLVLGVVLLLEQPPTSQDMTLAEAKKSGEGGG
jgi:UDP-GlcNAc:undecaprenyl-phosphate/decaprenyl-phosphate GlcNAc-1-phosphate transferase